MRKVNDIECNGKCWLILDTAKDRGMRRIVWSFQDRGDIVPLYHRTAFEPVSEVSPLLVEVSPGGDMLEWFRLGAAEHGYGIALDCSASREDLLSHLHTLIEAIMPNYNLVLFRFFSPPSAAAFAGALTKEETVEFLGPADRLFCPIPDEPGWLMLENPVEEKIKREREAWRISPAQIAALEEQVEFSMLGRLSRWLKNTLPGYDPAADPDLGALRRYVGEARSMGLTWESSFGHVAALRLSRRKNIFAEGMDLTAIMRSKDVREGQKLELMAGLLLLSMEEKHGAES